MSCLHRGAPLPSIAQWISGLFGSVDLAPSDITAALVLAAAAQRRRRKNRIKRALNPIIKAASNAATSQTSDQISETTGSVDDRKNQFSVLIVVTYYYAGAMYWPQKAKLHHLSSATVEQSVTITHNGCVSLAMTHG